MERIGPIMLIEGPNKSSKVPYSRSLYLDCADKVLIDSGADPKSLLQIEKENGIQLIMNTHYHPDHTSHNYLFPNAEKLINPIEYETAQSIEGISRANGVYQEWGPKGVETWKQNLPSSWVKSLGQLTGTYEYEKEYNFSGIKVQFLHSPGHTSGLSCPYFPDLGVVFAGDYDMTTFGPWYNGTDGDIDDFIRSGKRLLELDANTYITGHQKGVFTRQEFAVAMETYLAIINQRDEKIERYVAQGLSFEELTSIGIFYPKRTLDNGILKTWERTGIRKHLHRLGLTVPELSRVYTSAK